MYILKHHKKKNNKLLSKNSYINNKLPFPKKYKSGYIFNYITAILLYELLSYIYYIL